MSCVQDHVHERFGGFGTGQYGSGMHEFVLRKDDEGNVRMWCRKSSQASGWLPDGEGYLVFKTIPKGPPQLAPAKPDVKWQREKVEETVSAWFPYMKVSAAEEARIRDEWSRVFSALPPPDGDTNTLPDIMKPKWMDLPKCPPLRGPEADVRRNVSTSATENPSVNPVTGPGRSAAQVYPFVL